ncbi:uncharacterized protein [Typha angustifolia]|uniref:uncharacterized protein isoform X2 n=1 Tax=Typha angustifolia TaxID=59011 RepID=UPI003C2B21E2
METEAAMLEEPMAKKNKQGETTDLGFIHIANPPEYENKLVGNIEKYLNSLDIKSNISCSISSHNIENIEKYQTDARVTEKSSSLHEASDSVTEGTLNSSDGESFIEALMEVQIPLESALSDSFSALQGESTGKEDIPESGKLSKYYQNDECGKGKDESHKLHLTEDKGPTEDLPREESLPKTDESNIMDEKATIDDNNPLTDREISSEDIAVPEIENEDSKVENEQAIEVTDDIILQKEMAKNKDNIQQISDKSREPNLESAEDEEMNHKSDKLELKETALQCDIMIGDNLHNSREAHDSAMEKESPESLDHAVETIVASPTTEIDFPMEEKKAVNRSTENTTENQQKHLENMKDHVDDLKQEKSIYPELTEKNLEEFIDKSESEMVKPNITGSMNPDILSVSENLEIAQQNGDEQIERSSNFSVLELKEHCPQEDGEDKERDPEKEQSTEGLRSDSGSQHHDTSDYGKTLEKVSVNELSVMLLPQEEHVKKNQVLSDIVDQGVMTPQQLQATSAIATEEICKDDKNIEINNNLSTAMMKKNVEKSHSVDNEAVHIGSTDSAEIDKGPETFYVSKNVKNKELDNKKQVQDGHMDIIVSENVEVQSIQNVQVNVTSLEAHIVLQRESNLQTNDATRYIEKILGREEDMINEAEVNPEEKLKRDQECGKAVDERESEVSAIPTHSPEISVDVIKENLENTDSTDGVGDGVPEEKVDNRNINASFNRQLADEMQSMKEEQEKKVPVETSETVTDEDQCYTNAVDELTEMEPSNYQGSISVIGHSVVADTSEIENAEETSLVKTKEHVEKLSNDIRVEPRKVHDGPKDQMPEDPSNVVCKGVDLTEIINPEKEKIDKEGSPTSAEGVPMTRGRCYTNVIDKSELTEMEPSNYQGFINIVGHSVVADMTERENTKESSLINTKEHVEEINNEEPVEPRKVHDEPKDHMLEYPLNVVCKVVDLTENINPEKEKIGKEGSSTSMEGVPMTDRGQCYRNAIDKSILTQMEPSNYQGFINVVGHLVAANSSEIGNAEETSLIKTKEHVEEINNEIPVEHIKVHDEPMDHMLEDPVNVVRKGVDLTKIINPEKEKIDKERSPTRLEGILVTDEGQCYINAVDKPELTEMEPSNYQGFINVVGHSVVPDSSETGNAEETSLIKTKEHVKEINYEVHVEYRKVDEPKDHMLEDPLNVERKVVDLTEIINPEKESIDKEGSSTSMEGVPMTDGGQCYGNAIDKSEFTETEQSNYQCFINVVCHSVVPDTAERKNAEETSLFKTKEHVKEINNDEPVEPRKVHDEPTDHMLEDTVTIVCKEVDLTEIINPEKENIDKEGSPTCIEGVPVMDNGQCDRNAVDKSELTEMEPSNCQSFINVVGQSVEAETSETEYAEETSLVKTNEHVEEINNEVLVEQRKLHDEPKDHMLEDPLKVEHKEIDLIEIINLEKEKIDKEGSPTSMEGISHDSIPELPNELIPACQNPPPNNLSEEMEFTSEKNENSFEKIGEKGQNEMEVCGVVDEVKLDLESESIEKPPGLVSEFFCCETVTYAEDIGLDSSGENFSMTSTSKKVDFASEKNENSCEKVGENPLGKELVEATTEVCGIIDQVKLELELENIENSTESVSVEFFHETSAYAEAIELDNSRKGPPFRQIIAKENEVKEICTEKTENEDHDRDTDGFLEVVAQTDNCERIEDYRNTKLIITGVERANETMTKPNFDEEKTENEIQTELNQVKQVMQLSEENLNRVTSIEEISSGEIQNNLLEKEKCKSKIENLSNEASEKLIFSKDGVSTKEHEEKGSAEKQGEVIQEKGEVFVMPEQTASEVVSEVTTHILDADEKISNIINQNCDSKPTTMDNKNISNKLDASNTCLLIGQHKDDLVDKMHEEATDSASKEQLHETTGSNDSKDKDYQKEEECQYLQESVSEDKKQDTTSEKELTKNENSKEDPNIMKMICEEVDVNKENVMANIVEEERLEKNLKDNPDKHVCSVQTICTSLDKNHEEDLKFEEQSHQTIISKDSILQSIDKERSEPETFDFIIAKVQTDVSEATGVGEDGDKVEEVPEVPSKYGATKIATLEDRVSAQKNIDDIADAIKEKHQEVLDTFSEELHQITNIKEGTEADGNKDEEDYQEDKIVTESVIEDPNKNTTCETEFTKNHNLIDNLDINKMIPVMNDMNESAEAAKVEDENLVQKNTGDIPDRNEQVMKAIHDKVDKKHDEEPKYVCAEQIGKSTKTAENIEIAEHDKQIDTEKLEAVIEAVTVLEDNNQVTISKTDYEIQKNMEDNMLNIMKESLSNSQDLATGSLEFDGLDARSNELHQRIDILELAEDKVPASITSRSSLDSTINPMQEEEDSKSDKTSRSTSEKNVTRNACEIELEEKRDKEVPKNEEISHTPLKSSPSMMSEWIKRFCEFGEGQLIEEEIKHSDACSLTIDNDRNIVETRLHEKEGKKICDDAEPETAPSNPDNEKSKVTTEEIKTVVQNIEKTADCEPVKIQISETGDMKINADEVQAFEERSPKKENTIVLQQDDNKNSSIKDMVDTYEMIDDATLTTIPLADKAALKSLHQGQRELATVDDVTMENNHFKYQVPNYEVVSSTEQNMEEMTEACPAKAKDEMFKDNYNLDSQSREFDIVNSKEKKCITKIQDNLPLILALAEETRQVEIKHEVYSDHDRWTQETLTKNNISDVDASKKDNNSEETEEASAILHEEQSQQITTGTGVTQNHSMEGTLTTFEEIVSEMTSSIASLSQGNEPSQKSRQERKSDDGTISDGVSVLSTMRKVQSQGTGNDEENEASTLVSEELDPEKNKEKETPIRELDACIEIASNLLSTEPASIPDTENAAGEIVSEEALKHNNQEVKDSKLASENTKSAVEKEDKFQLSHDERADDDSLPLRGFLLKYDLETHARIVGFEDQKQYNSKDSEIKEQTVSEKENKEYQEIGENAEEKKMKDKEQEEKIELQLSLKVSEQIYNCEYNKDNSEENKISEIKIIKLGNVQSEKAANISNAMEDGDETDGLALHSENKNEKELDTIDIKEMEKEKQEKVNEIQGVKEVFEAITKAKCNNVNLEDKENTREGPENKITEDLENEKLLHSGVGYSSERVIQEYKDKMHTHGHEMLHVNDDTEELLEEVDLESTNDGLPKKLIDDLFDTSKPVEEIKYMEASDSYAELEGTELENLQEAEKIKSILLRDEEKADMQLGIVAKTTFDNLGTVNANKEIKNITEKDIAVGTPDLSHARDEKNHVSSRIHDNEATSTDWGNKLEPNESEDSVNEEPSEEVTNFVAIPSEQILMMDEDKEKNIHVSSVAIATGGETMPNPRDEPEIISEVLVREVTEEEIGTTEMHYKFAKETVALEGSTEIEKFVHVSTDSEFIFDALNADNERHQTDTGNLTNKDNQIIQQDELPVSRYLMDRILQKESGKLDQTLEVKPEDNVEEEKLQDETSKKNSELSILKQEGNLVSLSTEQITYDTMSERKTEDPKTSESGYDLVEELIHVSKKVIENSIVENIHKAPQLSTVDEDVNEEVSFELTSEEKSEPDRKVDVEDIRNTDLSLEDKVPTTNQERGMARQQDCRSLNNDTDIPIVPEASKEDSFQQGRESAETLCHIPNNDKAPYVVPEEKIPPIAVPDGNAERLLHKEEILLSFDRQQTDKSSTSSNIGDEAPEVLRTLSEDIKIENEKEKQENIIEKEEVRKSVTESGVMKNDLPEEQKVSEQKIPSTAVPVENADSLLHKEELLPNFNSRQTGKSFTSSDIEDKAPDVLKTLPESIIVENEKEKQEEIIVNKGEVRKCVIEIPSGAIKNDLPKEQKVTDTQKGQQPDPVVEFANEAVEIDEKIMETNKPNTCIREKQTEKVENANIEEEKTDDEKCEKEEEDEDKTEKSGHNIELILEAREAELKPAHKKSHNILSGVGSKVKHSIAKVKKAITGKSPRPKTVTKIKEKDGTQ